MFALTRRAGLCNVPPTFGVFPVALNVLVEDALLTAPQCLSYLPGEVLNMQAKRIIGNLYFFKL
jgi:hypothetical protein